MIESGLRLERHGVSADGSADTPLPLEEGGSADALETLEFAEVLRLVAAEAAGPLGAERIRRRRPRGDLFWIRRELATVAEVASLLRRHDPVPVAAAPDAAEALNRLRLEGSVLEGGELARLRLVLGAARANLAELLRIADAAPTTRELHCTLPPASLDRRLDASVDADGVVLDSASSELAAARRTVQSARARLIRRLEALLRDVEGGAGGSVTVRAGRYVIPVRRDDRGRPAGIIHDESASQSTLFIEPSEAIELGNALRAAEADEQREVLRVLRALTDLLRPEAAALASAQEMNVRFDDLVARARFAVRAEGALPAMEPAPGRLDIRRGRHPLLLAGGAPVVPFDLVLAPAERTVLISGPNTGGKTVLLKAVGVLAALAQSGIIPPVDEGSTLPVFTRFFADIGDHQSIAANLSTFAAHLRTLRRVLQDADAESLVLLDEVGGGTDPAEGAALAAAALVSLTGRRALTLATTHLGALKTLPERDAGVVNGSLEFDAETIRPTYRFHKGVPGRSYGLAIARRLGLPTDVLAEAERDLPANVRQLDALLEAAEGRTRELQRQSQAAAEREMELANLTARLTRQAEDQAAREEELRRQEREAERQGRTQAKAYLLEARRRVEEALGVARAAVDEAAAREARRLVEEGVTAEAAALGQVEEPRAPSTGEAPAVGKQVRLPSGGIGEVMELRSDGRVVVAIGAVKLVVDAAGLEVVARAERRTSTRHTAAPDPAPAPFEVDLRGLTGEEAEAAALAAIDGAVLADNPYLRLIHGKGTGVVRERVQRLLSQDRRVARFAFAEANQGGSGVTVAEFAR